MTTLPRVHGVRPGERGERVPWWPVRRSRRHRTFLDADIIDDLRFFARAAKRRAHPIVRMQRSATKPRRVAHVVPILLVMAVLVSSGVLAADDGGQRRSCRCWADPAVYLSRGRPGAGQGIAAVSCSRPWRSIILTAPEQESGARFRLPPGSPSTANAFLQVDADIAGWGRRVRPGVSSCATAPGGLYVRARDYCLPQSGAAVRGHRGRAGGRTRRRPSRSPRAEDVEGPVST